MTYPFLKPKRFVGSSINDVTHFIRRINLWSKVVCHSHKIHDPCLPLQNVTCLLMDTSLNISAKIKFKNRENFILLKKLSILKKNCLLFLNHNLKTVNGNIFGWRTSRISYPKNKGEVEGCKIDVNIYVTSSVIFKLFIRIRVKSYYHKIGLNPIKLSPFHIVKRSTLVM